MKKDFAGFVAKFPIVNDKSTYLTTQSYNLIE